MVRWHHRLKRTWVWVNSGSWLWTVRPGMPQSMGLPRVGHDWEWTELGNISTECRAIREIGVVGIMKLPSCIWRKNLQHTPVLLERPWREDPCGLQSMESQIAWGHDWVWTHTSWPWILFSWGGLPYMKALVAQSWPTFGSSVHGVFQARILEWVAIPFRGSGPRDWIQVSCIAGDSLAFEPEKRLN